VHAFVGYKEKIVRRETTEAAEARRSKRKEKKKNDKIARMTGVV